jgi:hypothetical protein
MVIRGDPSPRETLSVTALLELTRTSTVGVYVYSLADDSFFISVRATEEEQVSSLFCPTGARRNFHFFSFPPQTQTSFSCALVSESLDKAEGFHADLVDSLSFAGTYAPIQGWRVAGDEHLFSATTTFATASGIYTTPSTGLYMVQSNVRIDGFSGNYVRTIISVDGSDGSSEGAVQWIDFSPSANYHSASGGGVYFLHRGQQIRLMAEGSGDSFFVQGESGFGVLRLPDYFIRPSCAADKAGDLRFPPGSPRGITTWAAKVTNSRV